jgi:Holliday junction resolvasome RuvABC DNA-binding subunit
VVIAQHDIWKYELHLPKKCTIIIINRGVGWEGSSSGSSSSNLNQRHTTSSPTEENISALVNMGFDRDSVVRALLSTNNDMEAAANQLLR